MGQWDSRCDGKARDGSVSVQGLWDSGKAMDEGKEGSGWCAVHGAGLGAWCGAEAVEYGVVAWFDVVYGVVCMCSSCHWSSEQEWAVVTVMSDKDRAGVLVLCVLTRAFQVMRRCLVVASRPTGIMIWRCTFQAFDVCLHGYCCM